MLNYFLVNVFMFLGLWFVSYLFARQEMKSGQQASRESLAFLGLGWVIWFISCVVWTILIVFI